MRKNNKQRRKKQVPDEVKIMPKNVEQENYMSAIDSAQIIFAIGPAGTGKTYIALKSGIEQLLQRKKRKLIQLRPAIEAGESLGHLPGDISEKLTPYHLPLQSLINDYGRYMNIDELKKQNRIQTLAVGFARGYTFNDCYVLVTEAQNMSPEQVKMILTRIGDNCTMVLEGDVEQHDLKHKKSGLMDAVEKFEDVENPAIKVVELMEIVRNPLIRDILDVYNRTGE